MKTRYIKYIGIITIAMLMASCSDFLKETSKDLSYVESYDDLDEIILGEVYFDKSQNSGYNGVKETLMSYVHFMTDETDIYTDPTLYYNRSNLTAYYLYGFISWQKKIGEDWKNAEVYDDTHEWKTIYKHITSANVVLKELDNLSAKTEVEQSQAERIKGEALFARAAEHFLLVNLYGNAYNTLSASTDLGIPIKLTEYITTDKYTRATVQEVYEQVTEDLIASQELLKGKETKSIYRIDYAGVCTFLSRVYLYMQDYTNAIKWAEEAIINAPGIIDLNSYTNAFFGLNNTEVMFTMGGNISAERLSKVYYDWGDLRVENGDFMVSQDLYTAFDDNDLRKSSFFSIESSFPGKVYTTKQTFSHGNIELSDCFTIRSAEAYLNLAEAAACSNNPEVAINAVNSLRKNRISSSAYAETQLTGEDLVTLIRNERRRELCFEGHRWFDLRRYQANSAYPQTKTLYQNVVIDAGDIYGKAVSRVDYYQLEPNDPAWTLPLPEFEINYNGFKDNARNERTPYKTEEY